MLPKFLTCSDNLSDALRSIASANIGRNCVWAVAHLFNHKFGRGLFWAVHSTENVVQVVGSAIKDRLDPLPFDQRRTINAIIAGYVGPQGLARAVGHAEELVIMAWDHMIEYSAKEYGEIPNAMTLYLSDSPCTIHDSKPSNNIPGKPPSCLAKLNLLRQEKHSITNWEIFYRKPWGILLQKKQGKLSPGEWASVQTGQALVRNDSCYKPFTPEMESLALNAGL